MINKQLAEGTKAIEKLFKGREISLLNLVDDKANKESALMQANRSPITPWEGTLFFARQRDSTHSQEHGIFLVDQENDRFQPTSYQQPAGLGMYSAPQRDHRLSESQQTRNL